MADQAINNTSVYHLSDEEIAKAKATIDKTILNTALDMAYSFSFTKDSICKMQVRDVYDGTDMKSEIKIKAKKPPKPIPDYMKVTLAPYIDYLKGKDAATPDNPLFPGYYGEKGAKQFQRHVKLYSRYGSFHGLTKQATENMRQSLSRQGLSLSESIDEIAKAMGKTKNAITKAIKPKPERKNVDSSYMGTFLKTPEGQYLKMFDEIAILPASIVLDPEKIKEIIDVNFSMIDKALKKDLKNLHSIMKMNNGIKISSVGEQKRAEMERKEVTLRSSYLKNKFGIITSLKNRVNQLKKELKKKKGSESLKDKSRRKGKFTGDLFEAAIMYDVPGLKKERRHTVQAEESETNPNITDTTQFDEKHLNIEVKGFLNRVSEIRNGISLVEWKKLEKNRIAMILAAQVMENTEPDSPDKEPDEYVNWHIKPDKDERRRWLKEKENTKKPDYSQILRTAKHLIDHEGIPAPELVKLKIGDVIATQYHRELLFPTTDIQRDWIVSEIQCQHDPSNEESVSRTMMLSEKARDIIYEHIKILQGIDRVYYGFHRNSPLVPNVLRKIPKKAIKEKVEIPLFADIKKEHSEDSVEENQESSSLMSTDKDTSEETEKRTVSGGGVPQKKIAREYSVFLTEELLKQHVEKYSRISSKPKGKKKKEYFSND